MKILCKRGKTLASSIPIINFAETCVHKKLFLCWSDGAEAAAEVEGINKQLKYMVNRHKKTDDMNVV